MKTRRRVGEALVLLLAVCFMAGTAGAAEITIWDGIGHTAPGNWSNETWGSWNGTSPYEIDEVEPNCVENDAWDIEGVFLANGQLTMRGGYNFATGVSSSPWNDGNDNVFRSGDIFIAVGATPYYGAGANALPGSPPTGWVDPVTGDGKGWGDYVGDYNYSYIIDIAWEDSSGTGDYTPSWAVYQVDDKTTASVVDDVFFSQNDAANPYRLESGGVATAWSGTASVTSVAASGLFDAGWQATFDLSWLQVADGVDVYFHFTQECGNDSIMAYTNLYTTNNQPVPEPASVALLGLGLLGLVASRARSKRL